MAKEERLEDPYAMNWSGIRSEDGLRKFLALTATAPARAKALLETMAKIRAAFEHESVRNKVVVFAPHGDAFEAARTALTGVEGGLAQFDSDTEAAERREILASFSQVDQLESDRQRPVGSAGVGGLRRGCAKGGREGGRDRRDGWAA